VHGAHRGPGRRLRVRLRVEVRDDAGPDLRRVGDAHIGRHPDHDLGLTLVRGPPPDGGHRDGGRHATAAGR